jgi:hypothetical protein
MSKRKRPPRPGSTSAAGASDVPKEHRRRLVLDRKEGRTAVLLRDDEKESQLEVAVSKLPADCRDEGAVLMVPLDSAGGLNWADAERDRAEEERRRKEARAELEKLSSTDDGGDIVL